MRIFKLRSKQPEAGTDVTRLWLAPGLARIGAVFGNGIRNNGVGMCWDTSAQRALWEADLQDVFDTYPDPDFDRELACVVSTVLDPPDTDEYERHDPYIGLRDVPNGAVRRLGSAHSELPVLTPDAKYALAIVADASTRRAVRRWTISALPEPGENADGLPEVLKPDPKWAIRVPLPQGRGIQQQLDGIATVLAVSPDGKRVACGFRDGSVTVWSFGSRRTVATIPALKRNKYVSFSAHRLVFSPDGTRIAAVRGRTINKRYGFQVSVWQLPSGEQEKGPKEKASANGVAFSPDGRTLLTARDDGTVGEWDTVTWKLRREFAWKIGKLFCVAFSPDGLTCAAGGEKGQVVVWDVDA